MVGYWDNDGGANTCANESKSGNMWPTVELLLCCLSPEKAAWSLKLDYPNTTVKQVGLSSVDEKK